MVSVFSKVIGLALVLLLGCVVWLPSAVAQDEPIETLEGMEVSGTVSVQEERQIQYTQTGYDDDHAIKRPHCSRYTQNPHRLARRS